MDEEFEFYSEEDDNNAGSSIEQAYHLESIKDKLARANYNSIIKHGIDLDTTENPEAIKKIIRDTIKYFQDLEEYEKCADLKCELENIDK